MVGFSPRKQQLTLYLIDGFAHDPELQARLGKHTTGQDCLYVERLDDLDLEVPRELIARSVQRIRVGQVRA